MLSDKEIKQYRKELSQLRDAYCEALNAFHTCKHYSASKEIHEAILPLNRAITYLEDALQGQDTTEEL